MRKKIMDDFEVFIKDKIKMNKFIKNCSKKRKLQKQVNTLEIIRESLVEEITDLNIKKKKLKKDIKELENEIRNSRRKSN